MSATARLLLSTGCAILLQPTSIEISQAQSPLNWSPISLTTPSGDTIRADTAWLTVPQRHALPNGASVQLPLMRLRATTARPGNPILYLAGGPGASGLGAFRDPDRGSLLVALREYGDVILFDQRGTGRARPSLVIPTTLALPADRSITDPAVVRDLVSRLRPYVDSMRQRGIDLDAYNTSESAADVEAIRRALGAERVTLWGHSYGSHLAFAVLKQNGRRVDRVIVGGINGLHQRWRLPSDGDTWIMRIDSAVKADTALRAAMPDFAGALRALLARLDREPLRATVDGKTVLIGGAELRTFLALQSGDAALAARLPAMVVALTAGDASRVAPEVQRALRDRPLGTAMSYTMHIASGVDDARRQQIARETPGALLGNAINFPFDDPAFRALWGVTDLGPAFRAAVKTDVPTLFLSGTIDGRTSITDAEEVRRGFARSAHVIVDGAGHNFYTRSPGVLETMKAFLADGTLESRHLSAPFVIRPPQ